MKTVRIKKLGENIRKNGFHYRLVMRTALKCLYEQREGGVIIAYEVFRIRLSKPHHRAIYDIANFDRVECFPAKEDWGKRGWTYHDLELALQRYNAL